MHKRHLHHLLKKLQQFKYGYIVAALILSSTVFVFAYRQNNLTALELRDRLLQVDAQDGDVEAALLDLREFTYTHMNANLSGGEGGIYPPIQLKYRYERLVTAEQARVESVNAQIYTEAQAHCEALMPTGVSRDRVPCIQEYVTARGVDEPRQIPDGLYKFDFLSPVWSPDLAGWSLVVSLVILTALITRIILGYWLRAQLRD